MNEEVLASSIEPGDHFWWDGRLRLASVVLNNDSGTWIADGTSDLWFAPGVTVLKHSWKK